MPYFPGGFYIDKWYFLLIVPAILFSLIVQAKMKSTYSKYANVPCSLGITGADSARIVLSSGGIGYMPVYPVNGQLTDNYDPKDKVIHLSQSSYAGSSIAAVGIAAHEAGHALQDAEGYSFLNLRNALVPVANFSSRISWWVFLLGLIMRLDILTVIGIVLFSGATLFHAVTLPVEINASRRAVKALRNNTGLTAEEFDGVKKVLTAAAMTYVASLASSALSLIRMILLSRRRSD